jgi:hypothetical protein
MVNQCTPGLWKYDPNDRDDLKVKDGIGRLIAEVNDNRTFTLEQCQANAKLIAAAPDMLQALINVRNHLNNYMFGDDPERTDAFNAIIKAIDKATK